MKRSISNKRLSKFGDNLEKLLCLVLEGINSDIARKLYRYGLLDNPVIQKIISHNSSHEFAGEKPEAQEIQELLDNTRLAAWMDQPINGFNSVPYTGNCLLPGFLIFKSENRDVIELLKQFENAKPSEIALQDLLHGLIFGYHREKVVKFVNQRELLHRIRKWLSRLGLNPSIPDVVPYGDIVFLNLRKPNIWKEKFMKKNIKTFEPPINFAHRDWYLGIKIPVFNH
jgi:hypothetical protein